MKSSEIRKRFLEFMAQNGHSILDSEPIITSEDKQVTDSTLFNTAGMQPLVPYLLGKEHPEGKRLASAQKCIRTIDIDEVGDSTHATFFEMLGNWSLGDYFKEEAIKLSYIFLTDKDTGLGLDPNKLYITCFAGNEDAPRDDESAEIWQKQGISKDRIYFLEDNWWSAGDNGPCGPDTEMFYNITDEDLGDLTFDEFKKSDDQKKVVEIWNDVFMEFEKEGGKVIGNLPHKNVDTGAGLERISAILQNRESIFETDLFSDILDLSKEITIDIRRARIVSDHFKASFFMLSEGLIPSNTDRGYILRRLLRRAIFNTKDRKLDSGFIVKVVEIIIDIYKDQYPEIIEQKDFIISEISKENEQFANSLKKGLSKLENILNQGNIDNNIFPSIEAFNLYQSHGLPLELIKEIISEKNLSVNEEEVNELIKRHQDSSRTASAGKFKGGLAGTSEMEIKYHTATHLLHKALKEVLGDHVYQKGSNITPDRLRFDFAHEDKLSDEEKQKVEDWVNDKIEKSLPVCQRNMPLNEAKDKGAIGLFEDKYGDEVSVYTIGDEQKGIFSMELCGGPHVENTSTLGKFKIKKEEASSKGVRRIKAILE